MKCTLPFLKKDVTLFKKEIPAKVLLRPQKLK